MEMLCIGYLLGAVSSIVFVGIGIAFGNAGKGAKDEEKDKKNDEDSRSGNNNDTYEWVYRDNEVLLHRRNGHVPDIHNRNRNRGGDERSYESMAEKAVMVLQNFRVGACRYETEAIDWMIEQFEKDEYPLGRNDWQE